MDLGFCRLCACNTAEVKIMTSQSFPVNLPCIKFNIPITYEIPSAVGGFDQDELTRYVYGSVLDMSVELHAANHLLQAGLCNKIKISSELKSLLSPKSDSMDRSVGSPI